VSQITAFDLIIGEFDTSERGQRWEVVQRLQAADIHADHLELGELLQVLLIVRTESLHWCLVKNQVVEISDVGITGHFLDLVLQGNHLSL